MSLAIVQQTLEASSPLVAIVGSTGILQGVYPEGYTRPYAIWFVISSVPLNTLSERPLMDDMRIHIELWSPKQSEATAMKNAALYAAESIGHVVFGPSWIYDETTKQHCWFMDLELFNPR